MAHDLFERQHIRAAQVKVRVRRRKTVKVGAADCGEQQRMRLRRDNAVKTRVNGHVQLVHILSAMAESPNGNILG